MNAHYAHLGRMIAVSFIYDDARIVGNLMREWKVQRDRRSKSNQFRN